MKETIGKFGLTTVSFLSVFFADIQAVMFAIGFLIMIDTFVAMWASWKHKGIESIVSRKMGRIITKLVLYPLSIIVAKVAQQYLAPAVPWIDVTAGIIASVEVKSIFENMSSLLGFNLWKRVKEVIWKDKPVED